MTTQFSIFCGTDTNGHDVDARQLALDLAAKYFPLGHSITEQTGRWQTANGSSVTEPTIVITWIATPDQIATDEAQKMVSGCAGAYKQLAFQEAVLITRQELDAVFI